MAHEVVTVKVVMNTPTEIAISIDKEPVHLTNVGPDDLVRWEIHPDSVGWTFTKHSSGASTGVAIKEAGAAFQDDGGANNQKHHKWHRNVKDHKLYSYSISVTNETVSKTPTTLVWDPSLMND
jgi:hypothetical protein